MFTDTHAHILSEYYDNIELLLKESLDNGVERIVNCGCNTASNKEILSLIETYKTMYGAIGIHPEEVKNYCQNDLDFIKNNINNPKIIAIGEIGLDYYYTKDNRNEQIELFECQMKIAQESNLPVIIHCRDAWKDTLDIIRKFNCNGIVHSFSGSYETALELIKNGYLLGINGVITFKNANLKDTFKRLPLTSLVFETDSPYLTPVPLRGKQNTPSNITLIVKFCENLFNKTSKQLAIITNQNLNQVFDKIK